MKSIKPVLMFAALLLIFVMGTGILLKQYNLYIRAYQELGKSISHLSIEPEVFVEEGQE